MRKYFQTAFSRNSTSTMNYYRKFSRKPHRFAVNRNPILEVCTEKYTHALRKRAPMFLDFKNESETSRKRDPCIIKITQDHIISSGLFLKRTFRRNIRKIMIKLNNRIGLIRIEYIVRLIFILYF